MIGGGDGECIVEASTIFPDPWPSPYLLGRLLTDGGVVGS